MSLEREVSEIQGRLAVLEKLVTGSLLDRLLDISLRAINAETTAIKSAELVQGMISDYSAPQGGEESYDGEMDIRGGGVYRRPAKVAGGGGEDGA